VLATTYNNIIKEGKAFDLVFVSSDQDEDSFKEYFGSMPWKAVPFSDEERRQKIGEDFGIRGIPALIVVNSQGQVISKDGRTDVTKHKEKAFDTWAAAK
jgi:nucleoredoxin